MKNLNLFTISILTLLSNNVFTKDSNQENTKKDQTPIENRQKNSPEKNFFKRIRQMHEEFEKELEQMFAYHERIYDDFFAENSKSDRSSSFDIRKIDIKKETDKNSEWVIVTVHLPKTKMKYSDINIKAKGNNLEGYVDYNEHKLNFFVIQGREFGTTLEYKNEQTGKKNNNEDQKFTKIVSSVSTQMTSIPQVASLEKTKANIENDKLVIKLPSANSRQDWTTINIAKNENEEVQQKNIKLNLK